MSDKEKKSEKNEENNYFNLTSNSNNENNVKEKKENSKEINLLYSNSNKLTKENEDSSFKYDFNINPFNEKNQSEFADNENNENSEDDEEFNLKEDDIKNNFNSENINFINNNLNKNIEEKYSNYFLNSFSYDSQNINNFSQIENNKKTLTRVPSNPIPLSYMNNMRSNQLFSFYQNPMSNSLNGINILNNFNFPNNSFTMNGKSGWICPNCKNFNYESKFFFKFFYNFFSENSM